MTEYAIYIKKENGIPLNGLCFIGSDAQSASLVVPLDCEVLRFDESHKDFDLLYSIIVTTNPIYKLPCNGGIVVNFETGDLTFVKETPPDLFDVVRAYRNTLLADTDYLVQVPDYPGTLLDQILEYRSALRDIPNLIIKNNWQTPEDVVWPTRPDHI